ncbi:MAG: RluA family pseudouridine synthase [Candidatus Aminicenantes bacterium]|nr:RluA family pseudouridine synthase [Candidatus Aminicenantes bacterium]
MTNVYDYHIQDDLNSRLDLFLAEKTKTLTRSQIKKLILLKKVTVNGTFQKASYRLKEGDRIRIEYTNHREFQLQPECIPLDIIWEERHFLVINKPPGLIVHPGAGNPDHTLVNALLYYFPKILEVGSPERPGIVHRLDKDTSGLLVIAKTSRAYFNLKSQFKQREVDKYYIGLVWGKMPEKSGRINYPIGRHGKHRERMSISAKKLRDAETIYDVQKQYDEFSLLELKPITGRTHQLRVHLAASGHPLLGDNYYGPAKEKRGCPRIFLHAHRMAFKHPELGSWLEFSAPMPEDLRNFLKTINPS